MDSNSFSVSKIYNQRFRKAPLHTIVFLDILEELHFKRLADFGLCQVQIFPFAFPFAQFV